MLGSVAFPCYWLQGSRGALVDAGITAITPTLEEHFGPGKKQPAFVLITHSHFDHVGALSVLRQLVPKLIVVGSHAAAALLSKPRVFDFIERMNRSQEEGGAGRHIPLHFEDLRVDMVVGQGDTLDLGDGVEVEVHLMPGHTRCSAAYLLKPDNILFGGDGLGSYISGTETGPQFTSSYNDYVESLRRIQTLSPEAIALPHQGVLTGEDARRHLAAAVTDAEAFRNEILALTDLGKSEQEVVNEMFPRLHKGFAANEPEENFRINLEAMVRVALRER
jgi:glyoxylase-like metal-dependent hydrolase (beta-lactamase superfamily II)